MHACVVLSFSSVKTLKATSASRWVNWDMIKPNWLLTREKNNNIFRLYRLYTMHIERPCHWGSNKDGLLTGQNGNDLGQLAKKVREHCSGLFRPTLIPDQTNLGLEVVGFESWPTAHYCPRAPLVNPAVGSEIQIKNMLWVNLHELFFFSLPLRFLCSCLRVF